MSLWVDAWELNHLHLGHHDVIEMLTTTQCVVLMDAFEEN